MLVPAVAIFSMHSNGLSARRREEIPAEPVVAGIMTLSAPLIAFVATRMLACDVMRETSARCLLVMEGCAVVGLLEEGVRVAEVARGRSGGEDLAVLRSPVVLSLPPVTGSRRSADPPGHTHR